MTITEKNFQAAVNFGGLLLAISVVLNIYFVMRNREVYRDQIQTDQRYQQLLIQEQALEGVTREFVAHAANDSKITEILQRYELISVAPQQPLQVKP